MNQRDHARYMKAKHKPSRAAYAEFLAGLKPGDTVGVVLASKAVLDTVEQVVSGPVSVVHCHNSGRERIHQGAVVVTRHQGSFSKVGGHGLFNADFFLVPSSRELLAEDALEELFTHIGGAGRLGWVSPRRWKPEQVIAAFALLLSFEEATGRGSWIENHFRPRNDRPTTLEALYKCYPAQRDLIDQQVKPFSDRYLAELEEARKEKAQEDALRATTVKAGKKLNGRRA